MSDLVAYETRGPVAVLTLNRPEQRNAVNAALAAALRETVARMEADDAVRVGVLTGAGEVFCAGMDLKAFLGGEGPEILFGAGRFAGFVDSPRAKPMIAAVNGPALAGGFEIVLACDLVVASETASFGLPEVGVGIFAVAGGPFRLARKIAPARALEIALTGERLSASEAHALGLVSRVVPPQEVLGAAIDLAGRIARNAPLGVAATLRISRAVGAADEHELWALSEGLWPDVAASSDAEEGARAFAERRSPNWLGK